MLFRMRARNAPESLMPEEYERWQQWRSRKINESGALSGAINRIEELRAGGLEESDATVLSDLEVYLEALS